MSNIRTVTNPTAGDDVLATWGQAVYTDVGALFDEKTLNSNSDSATITFNLNTSSIHTVTLGGNRTLALSNVTTGRPFFIRLVQDGTGSRTVTWWSGIKWPGGTAPTLSTTADAIDSFMFIPISAGVYDGYFAGFGLET